MKNCIIKLIVPQNGPYNLTHAIFSIESETLEKIKLVQELIRNNYSVLNYEDSDKRFLFSGVRILGPTGMLDAIDNDHLNEEQEEQLETYTYQITSDLAIDYKTLMAEYVGIRIFETYISLEAMFKNFEDVFEFEQEFTTEELESMV